MDDRFKKFAGETKTFEKNGFKLTLSPFKGKDLDLFLTVESKEDSIYKLVQKALEMNGDEVPSMKEIREDVPLSFILWVQECIDEVNNPK